MEELKKHVLLERKQSTNHLINIKIDDAGSVPNMCFCIINHNITYLELINITSQGNLKNTANFCCPRHCEQKNREKVAICIEFNHIQANPRAFGMTVALKIPTTEESQEHLLI